MKRLIAILTLASVLALPGFCQDFSANLYVFYGYPCVTQPDQFSAQLGVRYNTNGFAQPGLDPSCGPVAVTQRRLNRSNARADNIYLTLFGTLAPQNIHDQINTGWQFDYGAAIDAIWPQAQQSMVGCLGGAALTTRPPSYVVVQQTLWQAAPGVFASGQTFDPSGTIWVVDYYVSVGDGSVHFGVNGLTPTDGRFGTLLYEMQNYIWYQVTGQQVDAPCRG